MKKIQISPSILSADFSQLGNEIKRLEVEKKFSNGLCNKYPIVNNPFIYERKLNPSNLLK